MTAGTGIFHRDFKPLPYWWEAWRPTAEPPCDVPRRTSVAIGGGYAGLNAALELARSGTGSVVLEAQDFGFGASTRSGGAVSGGINLGKGLGAKRGRSDDRHLEVAALLGDAAASFRLIEDVIQRERIEC